MSSTSSRKLSVDTLRGLACLLLVTYHVIGYAPVAGLRLPAEHPLALMNDALALLRMPLFSFLSGFVYAWRPYSGEPRKFVKGKVRRLLIPLLLVGTFFAVVQAYTPGANDTVKNWHLLHIVPVAHYWFLESLFLIFMLTLVLERLGWLSTPGRFALVWLVGIVPFLFLEVPIYFGLQGAAFLLPFFLAGMASNRFSDRLPRAPVMLATGAAFTIAILYLVFIEQRIPSRTEFVSLVISVSICVFLLRCQFEVRWLAWIGVYSFAIYLFHSMFSAASRIGLLGMGVSSVAILLIAGVLVGVAGPIVVTAILRRVPGGNLPLGESSRTSGRGGRKSYAEGAEGIQEIKV
jgi:peptidoglycan/LPS O-acetylase OafA/YrhL